MVAQKEYAEIVLMARKGLLFFKLYFHFEIIVDCLAPVKKEYKWIPFIFYPTFRRGNIL